MVYTAYIQYLVEINQMSSNNASINLLPRAGDPERMVVSHLHTHLSILVSGSITVLKFLDT